MARMSTATNSSDAAVSRNHNNITPSNIETSLRSKGLPRSFRSGAHHRARFAYPAARPRQSRARNPAQCDIFARTVHA